MTKAEIENKETGVRKLVDADKAMSYLDKGWKLVSVELKKDKKRVSNNSAELFGDSFRSPDYIERQEEKMKKRIPLLRIFKKKIFLHKPFIR